MRGRGHLERTANLTIHKCQSLFHLPVEQAANRLGVSRRTIARVMRAYGYRRWPFRALQARHRRHLDRGTAFIDAQATVSQCSISNGTMNTRHSVSNAVQDVCNRRKSATYLTGRHSAQTTSCSEFENDSPRPIELHRNHQDTSSGVDWQPVKNTEGESKINKSESTSTTLCFHVPYNASLGSDHIDLKTARESILETAEESNTDENSMTETSSTRNKVSGLGVSNVTSLENHIFQHKMKIEIENTVASVTQCRFSTNPVSECETKGRAGSEKNQGSKRNICFANQMEEENSPHLWRKRRRAGNSNINERASKTPMPFPESLFLKSDSVLPDNFEDRHSFDEINHPDDAAPWMGITREELEILGVLRSTEPAWDTEWELSKKLQEAKSMEGGLFG